MPLRALLSGYVAPVKRVMKDRHTYTNNKLKIARNSLGYSQKKLAKALDIGLRSWQGYEQGSSYPGGKVFEGLSKLGFNTNWFFTEDKNVPMLSENVATKVSQQEGWDENKEEIQIQPLLNMTAKILTSTTAYRAVLATNVKTFHRSLEMEEDNSRMKQRLDSMEQELANIKKTLSKKSAGGQNTANVTS